MCYAQSTGMRPLATRASDACRYLALACYLALTLHCFAYLQGHALSAFRPFDRTASACPLGADVNPVRMSRNVSRMRINRLPDQRGIQDAVGATWGFPNRGGNSRLLLADVKPSLHEILAFGLNRLRRLRLHRQAGDPWASAPDACGELRLHLDP